MDAQAKLRDAARSLRKALPHEIEGVAIRVAGLLAAVADSLEAEARRAGADPAQVAYPVVTYDELAHAYLRHIQGDVLGDTPTNLASRLRSQGFPALPRHDDVDPQALKDVLDEMFMSDVEDLLPEGPYVIRTSTRDYLVPGYVSIPTPLSSP